MSTDKLKRWSQLRTAIPVWKINSPKIPSKYTKSWKGQRDRGRAALWTSKCGRLQGAIGVNHLLRLSFSHHFSYDADASGLGTKTRETQSERSLSTSTLLQSLFFLLCKCDLVFKNRSFRKKPYITSKILKIFKLRKITGIANFTIPANL